MALKTKIASHSHSGLLFDFDGVVVKSMEQHFAAWQKAFAEIGVHISSDEFFLMEGQGIEVISGKIGRAHGLSKKQVEAVRDRKVGYYNQFMEIGFYPHFLSLLQTLATKKIPMAVVTGGNRSRVEKTVAEHFPNTFRGLVCADDVERGKPAPDPFLAGAQILKLPAARCVVVENAPLGIEGAKAAGCTVIGITTTLNEKFLKQADYIVGDFKALGRLLNDLFEIDLNSQ